METLVDRVTTAFREQMWRTIRAPNSVALRREQAERVWLRLVRRGHAIVARDPELHLYLAMTADLARCERNIWGFLRERAMRRGPQFPPHFDKSTADFAAERAGQSAIVERFQRLAPRARMVLMARRRERMTYEQIAQRLGCSVGEARRLFVQALKTFVRTSKDRL